MHHTYDHHKERRAKNAITLDNKEKSPPFSLKKTGKNSNSGRTFVRWRLVITNKVMPVSFKRILHLQVI